MASLISALIIAIGEWFFHKYLDRHDSMKNTQIIDVQYVVANIY